VEPDYPGFYSWVVHLNVESEFQSFLIPFRCNTPNSLTLKLWMRWKLEVRVFRALMVWIKPEVTKTAIRGITQKVTPCCVTALVTK
jgi:hypothetical protein